MAKKKDKKEIPPMENRDITVPKEELDELLKKMLGISTYGGKDTLG